MLGTIRVCPRRMRPTETDREKPSVILNYGYGTETIGFAMSRPLTRPGFLGGVDDGRKGDQ
jgi:hypothetical protein